MEDLNPMNNSCVDPETGLYPRPADEVVDEITETECDNLQSYIGLDGLQKNNCDDLSSLICDIKQEVDAINVKDAIDIAANDASKCADDGLPTLASMFSRVLRYAQAATCVLCAYDPRVATILKTGRYPQILFGSIQEGGYPQWMSPEEYPKENSTLPVTSGGIYKAIQDAILAVWHLWEEQPEFTYFAQTLNDPDDPNNLEAQMAKDPASNGDTALVASGDGKTSLLYTYTDGQWVFTRELTAEDDNLTNFATTHIVKGYYATNGVYYFDGTWQVLDADLSGIQDKIEEIEKALEGAVASGDDNQYLLTTRPTLAEAQAVTCTEDKTTIVLVTG